MRKLIATLLVLSMMLCCLPATAESTPMAFEDIGIRLDFGNILVPLRTMLTCGRWAFSVTTPS